jgi:hypothetical protein
MTGPFDLQRLHELCGSLLPEAGGNGQAFRVVRALGPLGALVLRPDVLARAVAWQREMNGELGPLPPAPVRLVQRGQVGILLATRNPAALPLLRPAFVLPVEWRRGDASSPLLPTGLAVLADAVLRDLGLSGLSLHLASWLERDGADFSALDVSPDSAWAALAAAAIVTDDGGATLPDVLVSAAWTREQDQRGWVARVDHVPEKLDAALAEGARVVLLPQENAIEAAAWRDRNPRALIEIRHLSNAPGAPRRVLAPVLHALEAAPARAAGASFKQRSNYYIRMPEEGLNEYYRDELLDEVVAEMRPQVEDHPPLRDVSGLVIIASKSWSLGPLLASLFDPQRMLILHDGALPGPTRILSASLPTCGRSGRPDRHVQAVECEPGKTFSDDVAAAVAAFAGDADADRIVIDLTAGYRDFHFAVLSSLPRNAEVVFVHAPQDRRHPRVRPGTERLRRLVIPAR